MSTNLVEIVKSAGIIGAGGAGFPTHVKIDAEVDTVIVNGKVLMKNGELLEMDVEKIYAEANMRGHRLTR